MRKNFGITQSNSFEVVDIVYYFLHSPFTAHNKERNLSLKPEALVSMASSASLNEGTDGTEGIEGKDGIEGIDGTDGVIDRVLS